MNIGFHTNKLVKDKAYTIVKDVGIFFKPSNKKI